MSDRTRKILKLLRITWTAFCGLLCLALLLPWVRSYSRQDEWGGLVLSRWLFTESNNGALALGFVSTGDWPAPETLDWSVHSSQFADIYWRFPPERRIFRGFSIQAFGVLVVPFWSLMLASAFAGVAPWARHATRFSLRTLLIATTLIAAVLGFVAWMLRS